MSGTLLVMFLVVPKPNTRTKWNIYFVPIPPSNQRLSFVSLVWQLVRVQARA